MNRVDWAFICIGEFEGNRKICMHVFIDNVFSIDKHLVCDYLVSINCTYVQNANILVRKKWKENGYQST